MKKTLYIILFAAIISLFSTLIYTCVNAGETARTIITYGEMIKEINLLKNRLANMDIYTEPSGEGSLQIERDYKDGREVIRKVIYNKKGQLLSCDEYVSFQDKLIWEHKDMSVHFIITVEKNGNVKREELSFTPVFTPSPKATCTPVHAMSTPTPVQKVSPSATKVPLKITPTPSVNLKLKEKIIFISDRGGTMDIYTINTDGSNLHKITKEKYKKAFPSISSDGKKIIYSANRDGKWSIYTINIDGTMEKRLTNSGNNDIMPSFIDNNNIIFQSWRKGISGIYRMALDTKKVSLLTGSLMSIHPALYPDRTKIVFSGEKGGNFELYSIDINGKNLKQLTHSGFEKSFPSVSPDGEKIAFTGNNRGIWNIYIVEPAIGLQRKIDTGFNDSIYPCWTEDGKYIIFQALDKGKIGLFRINLTGQEIIKLTDNKSDNLHGRCQFIMVE